MGKTDAAFLANRKPAQANRRAYSSTSSKTRRRAFALQRSAKSTIGADPPGARSLMKMGQRSKTGHTKASLCFPPADIHSVGTAACPAHTQIAVLMGMTQWQACFELGTPPASHSQYGTTCIHFIFTSLATPANTPIALVLVTINNRKWQTPVKHEAQVAGRAIGMLMRAE